MGGPHKRQRTVSGPVPVLVEGYGSSDESASDSDVSVKQVASPAPAEVAEVAEDSEVHFEIVSEGSSSDDDENAIDLDDLDSDGSDSDSASGSGSGTVSPESGFIHLLNSSDINPYGSWETESLKIIGSPAFLEISNNKDRRKIFDSWAKTKIDQQVQDDDDASSAVEDLKESEFVKYIRFVESVPKDRLFIDFKKKNLDTLNKFELSIRDMEKIYKELVIFINRPVNTNIPLFEKIITNSKIFQRNSKLAMQDDQVRRFVEDLKSLLDDQDTDKLYKSLHELESKLNVSESLVHNVKYYIIPVKDRISTLVNAALRL
jgi:hypothetical protein